MNAQGVTMFLEHQESRLKEIIQNLRSDLGLPINEIKYELMNYQTPKNVKFK